MLNLSWRALRKSMFPFIALVVLLNEIKPESENKGKRLKCSFMYISMTSRPLPQNSANSSMPSPVQTVESTSKHTASARTKTSTTCCGQFFIAEAENGSLLIADECNRLATSSIVFMASSLCPERRPVIRWPDHRNKTHYANIGRRGVVKVQGHFLSSILIYPILLMNLTKNDRVSWPIN